MALSEANLTTSSTHGSVEGEPCQVGANEDNHSGQQLDCANNSEVTPLEGATNPLAGASNTPKVGESLPQEPWRTQLILLLSVRDSLAHGNFTQLKPDQKQDLLSFVKNFTPTDPPSSKLRQTMAPCFTFAEYYAMKFLTAKSPEDLEDLEDFGSLGLTPEQVADLCSAVTTLVAGRSTPAADPMSLFVWARILRIVLVLVDQPLLAAGIQCFELFLQLFIVKHQNGEKSVVPRCLSLCLSLTLLGVAWLQKWEHNVIFLVLQLCCQ